MSGGGGGKQTVGYKYRSGDRLLLGHDTFDKITKIRWGGKTSWEGSAEYDPNNPGEPVRININNPGLFGGESREGGVSGAIDVLFGHSTQKVHDYLAAKIGSIFLPAYRGVTSLVLRNFYIGNNPYIKELGITAQRIHRVRDGELQWYDEKAESLTVAEAYPSVWPILASGLSAFTITQGSLASFTEVMTPYGRGIQTNGSYGSSGIQRMEPSAFTPAYVSWLFKVDNKGRDDPIRMQLIGENGAIVFEFIPFRQPEVDPQRRPMVNVTYSNGTNGESLDVVLSEGVWYQLKVDVSWSDNREFTVRIMEGDVELVSKSFSNWPKTIIQGVGFVVDEISAYPMSATAAEPHLIRLYETGEMNPAHMIREWLTHPIWGRALPGSMIGDSYYDVADQLYAEGFGLSFYWSKEITHRDAINEIQRHIDAVRYIDPTTGKLEIKLIRDDYDPENLPLLDSSNSKVVKFDRKSRSELYNQITVKYKDRKTGEWASVSLRDDTAIRRLGRTRNKTFEYPGIWRADVAIMVAGRDLAANSREFTRATVKTNRRVANLKPGDVFKLTDPKSGILEMICRVGKRSDTAALKGEITLEVAEDVFGESWSVYTTPTGSRWDDPVGQPQDFSHATAFEKPYIITVAEAGDSYIDQMPSTACYFAWAGTRPSAGAHINYNLYAYPDGITQAPDFEFSIRGDFTPYAVVDGAVGDPLETVIPIHALDDIGALRVGHLVLVGDAPDDQRELAALDAIVTEGDVTLTLKRGVADTLPRPIADGTILYFIGDQYAYSSTEYLAGETVEGYGTPVNGQGYYLGPYTYLDVEMQGRFILPYPPANITINGLYYPTTQSAASGSGDIFINWVERNRVVQSNQIVAFTDASVDAEVGTTFNVTLYGEDDVQFSQSTELTTNMWTHAAADELTLGLTEYPYQGVFEYTGALPSPQPRLHSTVRITLNSQREGDASLQTYEHTIRRDGYGYSYGEGVN